MRAGARAARVVMGAALIGCAALGAAAPGLAAEFYEGKTLTLVVGFGPGGTDTAARIFARHAQKYIPGAPTIIVQNMPGAGTILAQNYIFEKARPDGLTIGFNPFQYMAQLTGEAGIRFKYEDYAFVGGVRSGPFLTYVRKDALAGGIKTGADVLRADGLKFTGRDPVHGIDVITTSAADLMGVKYRYIPGHQSDARVLTSIRQGETNFTGAGLSIWTQNIKTLAESGEVVPLWYHAFKDPSGKEIEEPSFGAPTFHAAYRTIHHKEPAGALWDAYAFAVEMQQTASFFIAGPPKMDRKLAAILGAGFERAAADPELIEETTKLNGMPYGFVPVAQAQGALQRLRDASPDFVKFWKDRLSVQAAR